MRPRTSWPLLTAVVLVCACVGLQCVINSYSQARILFGWRGEPVLVPFDHESGPAISHLTPEAKAAGLRVGDTVIALDGVPVTGWSRALAQIVQHKPGETLQVEATRNGTPMHFGIVLRTWPVPRGPGHVWLLAFAVFIQFLFPVACSLIGMWVVASRPQDPAAWWVLGILQFMSLFFAIYGIVYGAALDFQRVWAQVAGEYFTVSCAMLALTFPTRMALDRKWPWLKWAVVAAASVLLALDLLINVLDLHSHAALKHIPAAVLVWDDRADQGLMILSISLLCACISKHYFTAETADARRRLRVLLVGSQIGLWPIFLCVIIGVARGVDINRAVPFSVFIVALALLPLFPLSLAYSIVVERAMDVRILVRQGTRYALAKGTFWALQAGLGAAVAWATIAATRHHQQTVRDKVVILVCLLLFFAVRFIARKRAMDWIDRRFFREQYSAEQVLSELSAEAGRYTEVRPLLETICRRLSDTLHIQAMAVLLRQGNTFQLQLAEGLSLPEPFLLPAQSHSVRELEMVHRPATVYFDRPEQWLVEASDSERAALREMRAEVLLPLTGRSQLVGMLALGPKRSEAPYSKSDLQLLTSVGAQAGMAVENSQLISSLAQESAQRERMHREIEIAREVQERLFPQSFPQLDGVDIAAHCRPAHAVGGDYYDCVVMQEGALVESGHAPGQIISAASPTHTQGVRVGIAIGDVSGKGISAALLMASLRASLRGQTLGGGNDLARMMANINVLLYEASDLNRYATFFFAEYDADKRTLTYVNAGHNPPALLRRDAHAASGYKVLRLEEGGPVVGLLPDARYEQKKIAIEPGDVFLGYTDGISEAMDPADDEWGEDRMIDEASRCAVLPAAEMLARLFEAADGFAQGAPQHDDMTLVVVRFTP